VFVSQIFLRSERVERRDSRGEVGGTGHGARSVEGDLGGPDGALVTCALALCEPSLLGADVPRKVPIQSPSQDRSMGLPSLHAEMSRYVPSARLLSARPRI
jgi:hypothetical protein